MRFDLLIHGGRVIDPATGHDGRWDVAIRDGRIAAIDEDIPAATSQRTIDASRLIVTPGLIDLHTHVFRGFGYFGIDADAIASRSGVTTWVDAGSSGAFNLPAFHEYIVVPSSVRILAFVNISYLGLAGLNYDEFCNLDACDVDLLERTVERYRHVVVGIKVRMGSDKVGNQGLAPLRIARRASARCALPLMVHVADAPPPVEEVLAMLEPGDVITHAFTGGSQRLVDDTESVPESLRRALDMGVHLDVGHGSGSFSFRTAETLTAAGIWPNTISSDLHQVSMPGPALIDPLAQEVVARVRGDGGPAFTLLTVMSKFLHLGMGLPAVIAATTSAPARWLGLGVEESALAIGSRADVALLQLVDEPVDLFDIHGVKRTAQQSLRHQRTILGGQVVETLPMPELPPWIRLVDAPQGVTSAQAPTESLPG